MAAYIRSISTRANLVRRQHRPLLFSYILHEDDRKHNKNSIDEVPSALQGMRSNNLLQQRGYGSGLINNSSKFGRCLDFSVSPSIGASFCRYMSTTIGEGSEKIELMSDVADVLKDTTVQAVAQAAPAVNEVAVAAVDSFFPVAMLQHVIDAVHSFTGFNWWACIILTTILIRGATLPLLINQLKATSKLTLMRPRLEEIKQQMQDKGMEPAAVAEGQKQMKLLFTEYGVSPFTPLKGLFIQGPVFISFFLAIQNMVEKVPSFKSGGVYWFVDLTTPDSLYIFPILTALTFLITVECNMQEGMEGNPAAGTMKNVSRVLAAVSVPLTMGFPKAIFCYWITSNLFSLTYGLVLKVPGVRKALGVPQIPVSPASATSQSSFSLSSALKQALVARQEAAPSSSAESSSKISDHRISSSSVISQRIRSLEKQVKGRKKNKKR